MADRYDWALRLFLIYELTLMAVGLVVFVFLFLF